MGGLVALTLWRLREFIRFTSIRFDDPRGFDMVAAVMSHDRSEAEKLSNSGTEPTNDGEPVKSADSCRSELVANPYRRLMDLANPKTPFDPAQIRDYDPEIISEVLGTLFEVYSLKFPEESRKLRFISTARLGA